jgi:hypothetical protein
MSDATGADYDAEGRMTSFSNSSATTTYSYDGIGPGESIRGRGWGTRWDWQGC